MITIYRIEALSSKWTMIKRINKDLYNQAIKDFYSMDQCVDVINKMVVEFDCEFSIRVIFKR